MNRFNFYKSLYDSEIIKKDNLDKSINNPILIISIIIGILTYVIKVLDFKNLVTIDYLILTFLVITCLFLCISIFHIIFSYNNGLKGHEYEILGSSQDFEKYRCDMIDFLEGNQELADSDFKETLILKMTECIDVNTALNNKRTYNIYLSKKYIVFSLICSSFTFVQFLLKQLL